MDAITNPVFLNNINNKCFKDLLLTCCQSTFTPFVCSTATRINQDLSHLDVITTFIAK